MGLLSFRSKKPAVSGPVLMLQDAVAHGLVRFELRGVGEGQTSQVELRITKLTDAPLTILVPRGSAFRPIARP